MFLGRQECHRIIYHALGPLALDRKTFYWINYVPYILLASMACGL